MAIDNSSILAAPTARLQIIRELPALKVSVPNTAVSVNGGKLKRGCRLFEMGLRLI